MTIGAPWDFASTRGFAGALRAIIRAEGVRRDRARCSTRSGGAFGMVPVSLFQLLFALINPIQAALKFQKLARLDPEGPAARLFVALEDWLADGVPMPVGAAKELLIGWQIRNPPATGGWRFLGGTVDPAAGRRPGAGLLRRERQHRAAAAGAAARGAPCPARRDRHRRAPATSGMIVGSAARAEVWRPLAGFLAAQAGGIRPSIVG